jgi:ferredoxin
MCDEVYLELRQFLDGLPGGYPSTESGVELRVLQKLFSPEDADLFMKLRFFPEPPAVISKRLGVPESVAEERLADMASRGLLLKLESGGEVFYQISQFAAGIYEVSFMKSMDEELSGMLDELDPYLKTRMDQFRVVPVGAAVDAISTISSYDRMREVVMQQEIISLAPGFCLCSTCGTCMDICPMDAIGDAGSAMETDLGRCIGCGLCVSSCVESAVTMMPKGEVQSPPNTYFDLLSGLAKKRGVGFGHLDWAMKRTSGPAFLKLLPLMYRSHLAQPAANFMARRGWI